MPTIGSPDQKGLMLLRLIVERIRSGEIRKGNPKTFLQSLQAMNLLGKPGSGLALRHNGLSSLQRWTSRHGSLPKVGALIVYKKGHTPLRGFMKSNGRGYDPEGLAWWREEADRAIDFDWTPWVPMVRHKRVAEDFHDLHVRQDQPIDQPDPTTVAARLRKVGVTMSGVLRWMAAGQTEEEIVRQHPGVHRDDVRATLAYAAKQEEQIRLVDAGESPLSTIAREWQGGPSLPKSYPDDPRMDYLVKKYWRNRQ